MTNTALIETGAAVPITPRPITHGDLLDLAAQSLQSVLAGHAAELQTLIGQPREVLTLLEDLGDRLGRIQNCIASHTLACRMALLSEDGAK